MFIERPVVLRITGRVNTQISTSGAQVTFEPLLLIGIEKILRAVQENDDLILAQVGLGKLARVLSGRNLEAVLLAKADECRFSRLNTAVAESTGLAEDEDRLQWSGSCGLGYIDGCSVQNWQAPEEKGDHGHGISLSNPDVRR